jgi:GTPase SAR1 family protein
MPENNTTVSSPFKFLDYYHKEDKQIFFGRDAETEELYHRIYETNLVLLYGASGTGKTSIINCGLSNEFEASDWYPIFVRRQSNLIQSLRDELHRHTIKKKDIDTPLLDVVRSLYLDYFKPIYLIIDQFEELFILGDKDEQKAFFKQLDAILQAQNLQCKVILSMREEYLAYLSEYENILPNMFDNRLRIEKMNPRRLQDVIAGTAQAFDINLPDKEGVSQLIVERLRDKNHEVDLANLQVYLDRLYRSEFDRRKTQQRSDFIFDTELVKNLGTFDDVMSLFLDEQLGLLEKELIAMGVNQKNVPIDILFTMVTDNGTKQPVDINAIKRQLKNTKAIEPGIIDYSIGRFRDMRIIRDLS